MMIFHKNVTKGSIFCLFKGNLYKNSFPYVPFTYKNKRDEFECDTPVIYQDIHKKSFFDKFALFNIGLHIYDHVQIKIKYVTHNG